MEIKLFELRDRSTFVPVIAIRLSSRTEEERFLLSRAGYGTLSEDHSRYVLLGGLEDLKMTYSPYSQANRTRQVAHEYIQKNWDDLKSGEVIDVEYILGETKEKKQSESLQNYF